jgi:hypothetical protein
MSQHTPGPWVIDEYHADGFYKIRGAKEVICHVHSFSPNKKPESQATANAHLIIAAPDLLAACKALVGVYEGQEDAPMYVIKARAAIAKARP